MIKVMDYPTTEALLNSAETLLRELLPTPGNLMLSGGTTPYVLYNRLAAQPCKVHPDRQLFLSDERMVPFDSDHNNAHNLDPMLRALNCEERFIRIDTSLPEAKAAEHFASCLQAMETVDVGFLGMGSDGHTAGFFTREQANMKTGPLTLCTQRPDGMRGISVTPAFFQSVQKIILLVTGESKRAIIDTLLSQPETIPAGIALSDHPNVELWTDIRVS